jgi:glutamate decarboxylase
MMAHCLDVPNEPQTLEQILSDCKETLKYCVKTGHPRFFNQLSTGLDVICLAGEWLTATANTNMFTYEIAPVFTLIEDVVLIKMRECVGWTDGEGDGIFAPGGAISNLYAVAVARHKAMPDSKSAGLSTAPRLVMFTSEQSHFSIRRAAAILGIGTDNVIMIRTDSRGKMDVLDLEAKIDQSKANGSRPFLVVATSGTTVLGAFDPLPEIADVCLKNDLWFHVDAAWGGGALLSKKHRSLLDGIERADSITWNPHKLMGALLQCSAILVKHKGLMEACNSSNATYLFQQDKHYDLTYDTGDKAIQCGRHNDVFKLWLMWRSKGDSGFSKHVEHLMDMSRYFQRRMAEREGFEIVLKNPEFLNICFWYVPTSLRGLRHGQERDEKLAKVAPRMKAMMMEKGSTMIGYQPLGNRPNFFRLVVSNPGTSRADLDFLLDELERIGEETN